MRISKILITLVALGCCQLAWGQAQHGGHGGGSEDSAATCAKAKISHFSPEPLALVMPGSAFSFFVSGINGPGHVHVSIRDQPVAISTEDKDSFYVVNGKLPLSYKNETVRISVKAKAKYSKCDAESGWLLKIGE